MMQVPGFPSASYAGLVADDLGRSDDRAPLVLLHGLTFDRSMWRRALTELETIDPGRRAIALDLPGHGDSPDSPPYALETIVERVHAAVVDAGLEDPIVVGHSASAGTATVYAAQHRTRGVIAVEGTIRVGGFAAMAQSVEPILRGSGFDDAWARIARNAFRLEEVDPEVRDFVMATSKPRQEIVLGYWQDLFERTPAELDALVVGGAAAIRAAGIPYIAVLGADPSPEEVAWTDANQPGTRILVWPGSGHFPHLAHPRHFAGLLAETAAWVRSRNDVGLYAGRGGRGGTDRRGVCHEQLRDEPQALARGHPAAAIGVGRPKPIGQSHAQLGDFDGRHRRDGSDRRCELLDVVGDDLAAAALRAGELRPGGRIGRRVRPVLVEQPPPSRWNGILGCSHPIEFSFDPILE